MICNDHQCVPDCENNIASIFSCKDFSENSFYIQSSFGNECRRNIFPIKTETPPQNLFWSLGEPVVKPWMLKKNFMAPFFYGWCSTASRLEPLRGGSLLFTSKSQKFLVLILPTSEGWKAESTLEPPSGFEHGTPRLGIQRLNH